MTFSGFISQLAHCLLMLTFLFPFNFPSLLLKFLTLGASPGLPVLCFWPWPVQGSCLPAVPSVISGSVQPICLAADTEPLEPLFSCSIFVSFSNTRFPLGSPLKVHVSCFSFLPCQENLATASIKVIIRP